MDGLKLAYSGPFEITEFYKVIDEWITKKGKEKEIKKKSEHVEPKGKKIEYLIEVWGDVSNYSRSVVRLDARLTDLKEISVKKQNKKKLLNTGNVLLIFDGILEEEKKGKWQQKPLFYFMRAVFDKFVWKFYTNKFEDKIAADVNDLYETLNDFFSKYKA
ncbi:MAG: hypothetical protein KJ561_02635 [Nanoarchaeota archaeon]|nr:hypothetical protein [Nanoarchaeota archaeon]